MASSTDASGAGSRDPGRPLPPTVSFPLPPCPVVNRHRRHRRRAEAFDVPRPQKTHQGAVVHHRHIDLPSRQQSARLIEWGVVGNRLQIVFASAS